MNRNRRGAAVVEFAIVAPLFCLLTLGMIEYGRMVQVQQVITNASREGARVAATGATAAQVKTAVTSYLTAARVPTGSVAVTCGPTNVSQGQPIAVTVSVPYVAVAWVPPMLLKGSTLTAQSTFARQ